MENKSTTPVAHISARRRDRFLSLQEKVTERLLESQERYSALSKC